MVIASCLQVNDTQESLSMSSEIIEIDAKFTELLKSLNIPNVQQFALKAGIHHQTVRSQLDKGRLSQEVLAKISEFGGDVNWLLTGEGPMLRTGATGGAVDPEGMQDEFSLRVDQAERKATEALIALEAEKRMNAALVREGATLRAALTDALADKAHLREAASRWGQVADDARGGSLGISLTNRERSLLTLFRSLSVKYQRSILDNARDLSHPEKKPDTPDKSPQPKRPNP